MRFIAVSPRLFRKILDLISILRSEGITAANDGNELQATDAKEPEQLFCCHQLVWFFEAPDFVQTDAMFISMTWVYQRVIRPFSSLGSLLLRRDITSSSPHSLAGLDSSTL